MFYWISLQLECQCQELHSEQHVTKVENVKLKQTNDDLARELELVSHELTLAQEQLSLLQEQSTRLHEEKEMWVSLLLSRTTEHKLDSCFWKNWLITFEHREIYRLTEGLQRERASLLKQLDLLRYDPAEAREVTAAEDFDVPVSYRMHVHMSEKISDGAKPESLVSLVK